MTIRTACKDDLDRIESISEPYVMDSYRDQITNTIVNRTTDDTFTCYVYENADSVVVGFMASILYKEPVTDIEIKRPGQIDLPAGNGLLVKYGYIDPAYVGRGIGSRLMYELISAAVDTIQYIFAETWIKPDKPSSDALLNNIGFTEVYRSESYYGTVDSQELCHGCERPLSECRCAGAIHLAEEPKTVLSNLQRKFE